MAEFTSLSTQGGVTNIVIAQVGIGLLRIQGYFYGGADQYLQLFNQNYIPLANSLPDKTFTLTAGAPFSFTFSPGEACFADGLIAAVSSTRANFTQSVSKMDVFGELITYRPIWSGLSVIGDLTNGVNSLQVWAAAAGEKGIYMVNDIENSGNPRYLMLFAKDAPNNGDIPVREWYVDPAVSIIELDFGDAGIRLPSCTFWSSTTPGVLTKAADNTSSIQAFYK